MEYTINVELVFHWIPTRTGVEKCGVGHGVGDGLPYGPSYGLAVVSFVKAQLSIAANLCKLCAPLICHIYDSTLSFWWHFTQISYADSRLESGRPECHINTTFGEPSHERGIIIKHLSLISVR